MKNKLLIIVLSVVLTIFSGCKTESTDAAEDDYTLLIYMCGSSLESKNGAASDDISELLSADIPHNVNVVLETGGSVSWKKHGISAEKLQRYRISDNKPELLEEIKLSSMGNSSTLREFIDWGAENFPAKKTALIIWDHGGGFLKGICKDEIFGGDWLTVDEFDDALKSCSFSRGFDFIGFDACFMANYETALVAAKYTDCLIAPEDEEPAGGWNYTEIANSLGSGDEINAILSGFSKGNGKEKFTLSVINLTQLDKVKSVLKNCINKGKTAFEKAINSAYRIGDFYDMGEIARQLDLSADFSDCVTVVASGDLRDLSGLSFCFPDKSDFADYLEKCPDDEYALFLRNSFLGNLTS